MRATLADESKHHTWTYSFTRPLHVPASWHVGQHVVGDCSKGVQYLCKWAGAPDPMENGYGEWGNSYTLWIHLRHLDHPSLLLVGDIVTFGHDGEEHAAMVLERSTAGNPLLWSFGHEGAPNTYRLHDDHRPAQYLRLPVPSIPTKQEELHKKTGWFSWVAWKLGEGDWKGLGKANRKYRPAVPKRIPFSWWRRYVRFLRNRNKGNKAKSPK